MDDQMRTVCSAWIAGFQKEWKGKGLWSTHFYSQRYLGNFPGRMKCVRTETGQNYNRSNFFVKEIRGRVRFPSKRGLGERKSPVMSLS